MYIHILVMTENKPILTISVAASLLKLHPRTIMLYEEAGFIIPFRTNTKRRLFSVNDLNKLQFIKYLTQVEGINLSGVGSIFKALDFVKGRKVNLKKHLYPNFKLKKLV